MNYQIETKLNRKWLTTGIVFATPAEANMFVATMSCYQKLINNRQFRIIETYDSVTVQYHDDDFKIKLAII